jgi:hypothetical protein
MQRNLTYGCKRTRVSNAVVAGTTEIDCTSVDMLSGGFTAVDFVVLLGALTAGQVTKLKAQGNNDNGGTWNDLAGTLTAAAADADSNKTLILSLYRPQYRYIRAVVVRGTQNAVVDGVIAEQYLAANEPVTQDTSVSASKVVDYAAAGTA